MAQKFYGILCVALLALVSYALVSLPSLSATGMSSLVVAIILGILFGNIWHHPDSWAPGIQFCAKRILRIAIILYGFRVSFQQIASVGIEALVLDILVVTLTLLLGYFIGRKLLKLDREIALLISTGSAICGAAAVLAVEDILKSEPYKASVAVGTVVLFGTSAMFLYPLLYKSGMLALNHTEYGVFTGASIHEVAQALVAGANVSPEAGKIAVIVKMIRVLLLVPVLFILSFFNNRLIKHKDNKKRGITIPWFALGFVLIIAFNSLDVLPANLVHGINEIDTILLTMAMGAIGIETKLSKMKKVGIKPLYLALILFAWLMTSVYLLVKFGSLVS